MPARRARFVNWKPYTVEELDNLRRVWDSQLLTAGALLFALDGDYEDPADAGRDALRIRDALIVLLAGERAD